MDLADHNIGSRNSFVTLRNKPFPEQILTMIYSEMNCLFCLLCIYHYTVYSWYIAVLFIVELDISGLHVGPHFLAPRARYFYVKSR